MKEIETMMRMNGRNDTERDSENSTSQERKLGDLTRGIIYLTGGINGYILYSDGDIHS